MFTTTWATLNVIGQLNDAIAAYRQALALRPNFPEAHSNLVFCMNYQLGMEASVIAEEHRRWNQRHSEPLRPFILPHTNERSPNRPLRIGYVSLDFREHPVAYFLEGLLEHHDRTQVEVFCYADVANPDSMTVRMERLADHWRSITGLPDTEDHEHSDDPAHINECNSTSTLIHCSDSLSPIRNFLNRRLPPPHSP